LYNLQSNSCCEKKSIQGDPVNDPNVYRVCSADPAAASAAASERDAAFEPLLENSSVIMGKRALSFSSLEIKFFEEAKMHFN